MKNIEDEKYGNGEIGQQGRAEPTLIKISNKKGEGFTHEGDWMKIENPATGMGFQITAGALFNVLIAASNKKGSLLNIPSHSIKG